MTIETKNNSLSFDINLPQKINELILILNNLSLKKITLKTSWISSWDQIINWNYGYNSILVLLIVSSELKKKKIC